MTSQMKHILKMRSKLARVILSRDVPNWTRAVTALLELRKSNTLAMPFKLGWNCQGATSCPTFPTRIMIDSLKIQQQNWNMSWRWLQQSRSILQQARYPLIRLRHRHRTGSKTEKVLKISYELGFRKKQKSNGKSCQEMQNGYKFRCSKVPGISLRAGCQIQLAGAHLEHAAKDAASELLPTKSLWTQRNHLQLRGKRTQTDRTKTIQYQVVWGKRPNVSHLWVDEAHMWISVSLSSCYQELDP